MISFSIFRQHWKKISLVLNTFENIMKNGAFAILEQMLHLPYYFQIHDISKTLLWSKGFRLSSKFSNIFLFLFSIKMLGFRAEFTKCLSE